MGGESGGRGGSGGDGDGGSAGGGRFGGGGEGGGDGGSLGGGEFGGNGEGGYKGGGNDGRGEDGGCVGGAGEAGSRGVGNGETSKCPWTRRVALPLRVHHFKPLEVDAHAPDGNSTSSSPGGHVPDAARSRSSWLTRSPVSSKEIAGGDGGAWGGGGSGGALGGGRSISGVTVNLLLTTS